MSLFEGLLFKMPGKGMLFMLFVGGQSQSQVLKIHIMSVEFRAINTGEFGPAPNIHPARAAHAGSIHHNRIETDQRLDTIGPAQFADSPHHWDRSNGNHLIDFSRLQKLLEGFSDQSMSFI